VVWRSILTVQDITKQTKQHKSKQTIVSKRKTQEHAELIEHRRPFFVNSWRYNCMLPSLQQELWQDFIGFKLQPKYDIHSNLSWDVDFWLQVPIKEPHRTHFGVHLYIWTYLWVTDQVWGQDGWILAKFLYCVFMDRVKVHKLATISSHLDWTSLVYKGFIIWLLGKFFSKETVSSPEWAR